jgi:hypothetical protein
MRMGDHLLYLLNLFTGDRVGKVKASRVTPKPSCFYLLRLYLGPFYKDITI